MSEEQTKQKPVIAPKFGAVQAAVFAHEHSRKDGSGTFTKYSVNLTRSFTRDDGKTYEHTSSIDEKNIGNAMLALKGAQDWLAQNAAKEAA